MYAQWEADEKDGAPSVKVAPLRPFEVAFLHRRRAGLSRADLAASIRCSEFWLTQMERGREPCAALTEYWK